MGTLKYTIGSAMASTALFLAPAVPVAASETNISDSYNSTSTNTSTETNTETNNGIEQDADDRGKNFAVLGNCSGIFFNEISQSQYTDLVNGGGGQEWLQEWLNGPRAPQPSSNNQSSSSSQSAAGITFSPDCSVTNVQQAAAQAAGVVQAAQVSAPKGGVGAGVGGAVGSSLTAVLGIAGSIGSLGFGLRRFGN